MSYRPVDVLLRVAVLSSALGALIAACSGPPPRPNDSYGDPCDDDTQCREDAPTCVAIDAPAYTPGICSRPCGGPDGDTCVAGSECRDGDCIRCDATIAASVPTDGECGCDADCAAGRCTDGVCTVSCVSTPCEAGFSCDGRPPTCRECSGGGPFPEESPCGCDADCEAGLECIGDLCLRACQIDEMCGADQCGHELGAPPSCIAPDAACTGVGTVAPGEPCACNADCGPLGPYCLGVFAEGTRTTVCSNTCGPKQTCPSGTECCSTVPGNLYCLPSSVAAAAGATCL